MRVCPSCEGRNATNSAVCTRCGAALLDAAREAAAHTDTLPVQPEQVPTSLVDRAAAQLGEGQAQAAIENCRRAIALNPRHVEAHAVLGMALEQVGELQPALEAYEAVLVLAPERPVERQKASLLRLRLGHERPAPASRARPVEGRKLAGWWALAKDWVREHPAISGGVAAALLTFVVLATLLVGMGRAQAREQRRAQYEQELTLARQAGAAGQYLEATTHYDAAWKLQPGDAAVQAEWQQAYASSQYAAQAQQREMELASLPKYLPSNGRNPFDPVPIAPAAVPPPTVANQAASMAQMAVPPPTMNTSTVPPPTYETVKAPPREVPSPVIPSGRTRVTNVNGNQIITPVIAKSTSPKQAEAATAPADTQGKTSKGEITIWVSPRPAARPAAPQRQPAAGGDAASWRQAGEAASREGRADDAISNLERAAGAYEDMARQDPNNAAAHKQAADSCRTRIEILRQGNR
jgi:tetratricopeptide (TPR) repeat protein